MVQDGLSEETAADFVERIGASLAEGRTTPLGLDEIALALGDRASDTEAVAALLDALELRGVEVEQGPSPDLAAVLRSVLSLARQERNLGNSVHVVALAEKLEMEPRLVRVALLHAEVLMRG